jgi:hypothetical protein
VRTRQMILVFLVMILVFATSTRAQMKRVQRTPLVVMYAVCGSVHPQYECDDYGRKRRIAYLHGHQCNRVVAADIHQSL